MRPLVPTSSRWTTPCRSSAPLVLTRCPAAASPPMTVGPSQPGLGCAATPTGLSTTRMSSSSWTTRSPGTTSAGLAGAVSGLGRSTSSVAPAVTRSLFMLRTPSRLAPPSVTICAAAVRLTPNSRLMAASRRSPSRPSGTGRERRWVTPPSCLGPRLGPPAADLDALHAEQHREQAADHDRAVGDVEAGPDLEVDEVDDGASSRAGRAEDAVDEVAGGSGEQQPESD